MIKTVPAMAIFISFSLAGGAAAQTAPATTPGTMPGRTVDHVLGTNTTGTNPTGKNADLATSSPNANQAVARSNANSVQPAHGSNSFTAGQAQSRLERSNFQNVSGLKKDGDGVWRGTAMKDGAKVGVWVDYKGNVGQS
jgi:protein CpxP